MANDEDSLMDMLALRLSSVPFHDLNPHTHLTPAPINRSSTKPVTISYVGQLINPVMAADGNWTSFESALPLVGSSSVILPVVQLIDTVVKGSVLVDGSRSEWLISGDLCMVGDQLTVIAQSIYHLIDNHLIHQKRQSQICATGLLASLVRKPQASWDGRDPEVLSEDVDELDWIDSEICERSRIGIKETAWLEVSVGLARRDERDPHQWLELRHSLVSMKCKRSNDENHQSGEDLDRSLIDLEPVTVVGQLIGIRPESFEIFVQLQ